VAVGIAGLFIEAHPTPDEAKCDGPSALPLDILLPFLSQIKQLDEIVKKIEPDTDIEYDKSELEWAKYVYSNIIT
jgi:3-deoxy-D-manno-octulosonic acid (KDO) 8-phosphate synthase